MKTRQREERPNSSQRGHALPVRPAVLDARPRGYGRRRAALLAGVYALIGLHVAHWKISGRTLAPLELNEVMYTLEVGILTAGFLFMLTAMLATAVFGRFFCGWGCHILALEDLCAWLLGKAGIRPKPVRSRVLLYVPPAAMLYMFVWPQITRLLDGRPLPTLHLRSDAQGWASFVTENFWRNLPGPTIALLTFFICGFAIVYVLGSRSFCTYGCPYGVLFRLADKLAPGRIIAVGDCSDCAACTAVCSSHVRVHEELVRYGTIVNPACLKDLDCVAACDNGKVRFGWTRPPIFRSWFRTRLIRPKFDFTLGEDVLMGVVFLATLLIFRGLYDAVPFLLTLGLGGILAYGAAVLVRLATRRDVRFNSFQLKRAGRVTSTGRALAAVAAVFAVFTAHSAVVRYHHWRGYAIFDELDRRAAAATVSVGATLGSLEKTERSLETATPPELTRLAASSAPDMDRAIGHLEFCRRFGLFVSPKLQQRLAALYGARADVSAEAGQFDVAVGLLRAARALAPDDGRVAYNLGVMLSAGGKLEAAGRAFADAAALLPDDADVFNNWGHVLLRLNRPQEAEPALRRALALRPEHALAHFNLGRLLAQSGRGAEAESHFQEAARLDENIARALRE